MTSTSRATRVPPSSSAARAATFPPSECPTSVTPLRPSAPALWSTAVVSASSSGSPGGIAGLPWPGNASDTTRYRPAIRRIVGSHISLFPPQPWRKTSGSPSPPSRYASPGASRNPTPIPLSSSPSRGTTSLPPPQRSTAQCNAAAVRITGPNVTPGQPQARWGDVSGRPPRSGPIPVPAVVARIILVARRLPPGANRIQGVLDGRTAVGDRGTIGVTPAAAGRRRRAPERAAPLGSRSHRAAAHSFGSRSGRNGDEGRADGRRPRRRPAGRPRSARPRLGARLAPG